MSTHVYCGAVFLRSNLSCHVTKNYGIFCEQKFWLAKEIRTELLSEIIMSRIKLKQNNKISFKTKQ